MRPKPLIATRIATSILLRMNKPGPDAKCRNARALGLDKPSRVALCTWAAIILVRLATLSNRPESASACQRFRSVAALAFAAGRDQGLWDYFQAPHIARDYDAYFAAQQPVRVRRGSAACGTSPVRGWWSIWAAAPAGCSCRWPGGVFAAWRSICRPTCSKWSAKKPMPSNCRSIGCGPISSSWAACATSVGRLLHLHVQHAGHGPRP